MWGKRIGGCCKILVLTFNEMGQHCRNLIMGVAELTSILKGSGCCFENRLQGRKDRSRETSQETVAIIQVKNDGGLDQVGSSRRVNNYQSLDIFGRLSQHDLLKDWI